MLEQLRRIVQAVNAAPDLDAALGLIVHQVHSVMSVDVCSVYLTEPDTGDQVLMATQGLNPSAAGRVRLAAGEGLVGLVAERAEAVNLENAPRHARFKFVPESGEEPYHGFVGVPIIHQRASLGVLVVQQVAERRFEEADVAFLVTLAAQLAGGIAHARASGELESLRQRRSAQDRVLEGIAGAPGIGLGVGVVIYPPADLEAVPDRETDVPAREEAAFRAAIEQVVEDLKAMGGRLGSALPAEDRALFDAYMLMVNSESLVNATVARIRAGSWAPGALRQVIHEHASRFESMEDEYLRQRADDVRDLGRRILVRLGKKESTAADYPPNTILVGDDVSPIALAEVPAGRLVGVVSARGSGSSHVAILAHALGVPAVMGVGKLGLSTLDGHQLVLDGYRGRLYVDPGLTVREEFVRLARQERQLSEELKALKNLPAETPAGERIDLYVNTALLADAASSADLGADGIGLYRTEFPFLIQERFPSEEEQRQIYRPVLQAFAPRPVTLRTLDVGGDKVLPYFPMKEDNAFLGWRGMRFTLDHPEIFLTQLRAALRANEGIENLKLMLPMVTVVSELDEALRLIRQTYAELCEEGHAVVMPPVGVLIEVPAAVYQAEALARRVDFVSVGTNDLTQYLLAVDRTNERVAKLFDSLHPAVLRAVLQVVEAAHAAGRPVGICGEAAGDPAAALALLGTGVDSLSASPGNVSRIKRVIRAFSRAQVRALLERALAMEHPGPIRAMLTEALDEAGLGALVRPGA